MPASRFTVRRGLNNRAEVLISTGTAEAQSETLSVNIDYTNATKGDALLMLEAAKNKITAEPWPPQ